MRERLVAISKEKSMASSNKGGGTTTKIGRDAKTGEFIPVRDAVKRPSTTTVETIRRPAPAPAPRKGK